MFASVYLIRKPPERQIKDVKLGLSHIVGGPHQASAVAILGRDLDKSKAKAK